MTPDENDTIATFGDKLYFDFVTLAVELLFYGPALIVLYQVTGILRKRQKVSPAAKYLLFVAAFSGAVATARVVPFMWAVVSEIQGFFMAVDVEDLDDRWTITALGTLHPLTPFTSWMRALSYMVGDAVVVWRAGMIPDQNKIAMAFLHVLMVINALALLVFPCFWSFARTYAATHQVFLGTFQSVSGGLSGIVTGFACVLIGLRAWKHHKAVKGILHHPTNSQGVQVMIVLVETGLLYFVLQVLNTILSAVQNVLFAASDALLIAETVLDELCIILGTLSPLLVIVIVQENHSSAPAVSLPTIKTLPPAEGRSDDAPNVPAWVGSQPAWLKNTQISESQGSHSPETASLNEKV